MLMLINKTYGKISPIILQNQDDRGHFHQSPQGRLVVFLIAP